MTRDELKQKIEAKLGTELEYKSVESPGGARKISYLILRSSTDVALVSIVIREFKDGWKYWRSSVCLGFLAEMEELN